MTGPSEPRPTAAPDLGDQKPDFAAVMAPITTRLLPEQLDLLAAYGDLLFAANQRVNLTAVRDIEGIQRRLILESARLLPALEEALPSGSSASADIIDLGTGGGLPGMILAIARPDLRVTLLDATRKKVAFLEDVARQLHLRNVIPLHGRAEEIGQLPRYRGFFHLVTARAVSSLPVLLELGLPLLQDGGTLLLPKGVEIEEELAAGKTAAAELGGTITRASILPDVGSSVDTSLIDVAKTATTPKTYPRRSGTPSRSPLGLGKEKGRPAPKDRDGKRDEHD